MDLAVPIHEQHGHAALAGLRHQHLAGKPGVGSTERPREWAHYKRLRRLVYLRLFTVDAEIIVSHRYGAISIDGDVRSFMHQEVISGTLANYPEVVYEG